MSPVSVDGHTSTADPATRRDAPTRSAQSSAAHRALDAIVSRYLRAAAARVADDWRDEWAEELDPAAARAFLDSLVQAIEQRLPTDRWGTAFYEPGAAMHRRLIDRFRAQLLDDWAKHPHPPTSARVLAAIEYLERVRTHLEPDADQYFASRLLGPDGLELVVELAHDLRSPLTSILFLAETLRRGQSGDVNDIQRRQLGIIYSAALGLISVASDVIELARGGDHLTDTENQPFSVIEVLESVRDIVQPLAEEKGLQIRLLPPTPDSRMGHPVALSRVLLNLTTNALKFTDEGFVEIVARPRGVDRIEYSVRDTGNGIDPEVISTLFQPFRRGTTRSGYRFSGHGLGLAISRKLVEAMGSELHFETRQGWGTRFYFELIQPPAPHI